MFLGDYHTHTKYSDGKGSVTENALAAKARGLKEIAVTDHGFHLFRKGLKKYLRLKADCEEASAQTGVKVIAGAEADVFSLQGELDLSEKELAAVDYLVAGFHKFAPPKSCSDFFKMYFVTFFNGLLPTSKKAKERNTAALIAAVKRYPIKVLAHLNHSLKADVGAVAKACAEKGVLVEINAKHLKDFCGQWEALAKSGALFVVNSDAHKPRDVGALDAAFEKAVKEGIDPSRIVNYCGE